MTKKKKRKMTKKENSDELYAIAKLKNGELVKKLTFRISKDDWSELQMVLYLEDAKLATVINQLLVGWVAEKNLGYIENHHELFPPHSEEEKY
ncbi:MAG: hypothetical protein NG712_02865 [Omnitrophica bacterium]|nr:hypothetical protein [Candidatus Omnitrophota bacterium]